MKKVTAAILLAFFLLTLPNGVLALKSPVSLYVNGDEVSDQFPVMFQEQQLYVPAELIAEHLGLISSWDESTKTGTLKNDSETLQMEYGANRSTLLLNGEQLETTASVQFGESGPYIPIQWIEQMNGMKVLWDVLTSSVFVFISGKDVEVEAESPPVEEPEIIDENVIMFPEDIEQNRSKVLITGFRADDKTVSITTNGAADSSSMYLKGEDGQNDRIVIDIPNSLLTESLRDDQGRAYGVHEIDHPLINQIRYSLFEKETDTIRFVFDLKRRTEYQQYQNYQTNEIILQFISNDDAYLVVIDPGHGGHDPGTEGASGSHERDFTLKMSQKINERLSNDPRFNVVLTRTEDVFIALEERARIANDMNADLFVSVHGNSFDSATRGTETFYYGEENKWFASTMHEHLLEATGFKDRGIREEKYRVLNLAQMPAALLEIGYLDHALEESVMLDAGFQDRVADAVVQGIMEYLGVYE